MSTEGFTRVWNQTLNGNAWMRSTPHPTDALESLLERFYDEAVTQPPNTRRLFASIERLLRYLGSTEGRTHDNLWVTSHFLVPGDEHWEVDWADLPEQVVELLSRMGEEFLEAVDDPDWVRNFGDLPEQLLVQLKAYEADYSG
jgi:hypothetical protein